MEPIPRVNENTFLAIMTGRDPVNKAPAGMIINMTTVKAKQNYTYLECSCLIGDASLYQQGMRDLPPCCHDK